MSRKRVPSFVRELIIFGVLLIVLWRVASIHSVHRHLYRYLANQRSGLYTTLLTVEATLLGFIVAILTIVLGYAQASRFEIVRESRHWKSLFGSYTRAMRWSAYATVSFLTDRTASRPGQCPTSGRNRPLRSQSSDVRHRAGPNALDNGTHGPSCHYAWDTKAWRVEARRPS